MQQVGHLLVGEEQEGPFLEGVQKAPSSSPHSQLDNYSRSSDA
jgi:hypothetical protein